MIKNEKLQAGNECLHARDFGTARTLFEEVLKEDPENVCAVRGKMFCDLKISEIKELKEKSIVEGTRVPYTRYANSVPGNYNEYFIKIKEYFALAEGNLSLAEQIVNNERKNNSEAIMIAEASVKEAKTYLFTIHYDKNHRTRYGRWVMKMPPDIVGLIAFAVLVPLALIGCITGPGMSVFEKAWFFLFILAALCLFAAPGFIDIDRLIKAKSVLKDSDMNKEIERETEILRKQLEENSDALDSLYFTIRDLDQKIISRY